MAALAADITAEADAAGLTASQRHVAGVRTRWCLEDAEAILTLRAVISNGDSLPRWRARDRRELLRHPT